MSRELKKEILGIGLLGVFLFLLVSLISYYPLGPTSQNLCGKAGFHLADILVLVFGMMSYLLTAFILLFALFYLKKKDPPNIIIFSSRSCPLFYFPFYIAPDHCRQDRHEKRLNKLFGASGFLTDRTLMNFFGYFGGILICVILLLSPSFSLYRHQSFLYLRERLARKKTAERRKDIKVTTEERKEAPKEGKKAGPGISFQIF